MTSAFRVTIFSHAPTHYQLPKLGYMIQKCMPLRWLQLATQNLVRPLCGPPPPRHHPLKRSTRHPVSDKSSPIAAVQWQVGLISNWHPLFAMGRLTICEYWQTHTNVLEGLGQIVDDNVRTTDKGTMRNQFGYTHKMPFDICMPTLF